MITARQMYENKSLLCNKEDFSELIIQLEKHHIHAVDNYDRTILVNCDLESLDSVMEKSIKRWVRPSELTCSTNYLFTVMPLNKQQCIIRI